MRAFDIIKKKRDGGILSPEEIRFIVLGYTKDEIPDYQMSAFCMAVYFQGMTKEETTKLTLAMVESGEVVDLSSIPGIKVDKHSTGGVGDTTTLICAPLASACGVPVAKMSGRGLGHTGGTLDKLESIPGFRVELSREAFIRQVNRIGIAVASQSRELVPADRKIYALRDVTATIDSLPLIASSVMSKKIASGADAIVLDVKYGDGAFMKEKEKAEALARLMVQIGNQTGRKTVALLTSMEEPLGSYIGNALEVLEALEILSGKKAQSPLAEVAISLASYMVLLGKKSPSFEEAKKKVEEALYSRLALKKFAEWVKAQGGEPRIVEDFSLLPQASHRISFESPASGYLHAIRAEEIGYASLYLGAGRSKKGDTIDPAVGIVLKKRVGDKVKKGEILAEIHANKLDRISLCKEKLANAYKISQSPPMREPLIWKVVE
jgi:pyrimidine-nucleoside phosphorylase